MEQKGEQSRHPQPGQRKKKDQPQSRPEGATKQHSGGLHVHF
jgi:hypothetical protein